MKVIKLPPNQIPAMWEAIKFATKQTDNVQEEYYEDYYTELLHALLSNKAQCFVAIDDKKLIGLLVTRIVVNKITGAKQLFLQNVYAWEPFTRNIWDEAYILYTELARKEGCVKITYTSHNPVIWENMKLYGFNELERTYILPFNQGGV